MKKKHSRKIAQQKAVMEVMEENLDKWQSFKAIEKNYDRFVRNLKKINDYEVNLMADLTPLKEKKKSSKGELLEKLFPVISVLDVFAAETGDKKLAKLSGVSFSELERMKHNALVTYSIKVVKVSGALLEMEAQEGRKRSGYVIADYGLTSRHLKGLQAALEACLSDESAYARVRRKRKKSKARMKRRIRENNKLLRDQMDRMMHLFRDIQPSFYNSYIRSRIPEEPEEEPAADEKSTPPGNRGTPSV